MRWAVFFLMAVGSAAATKASDPDFADEASPRAEHIACSSGELACLSRAAARAAAGDIVGAAIATDALARENFARADEVMQRGFALRAAGDNRGALAAFDEGALYLATRSAVFLTRGDLHWRMGAPQKAMADYDEAIFLDPANAPAYAYRASLFRELGDDQRAMEDCNTALTHDPLCAAAFAVRGDIKLCSDRYDDAISDYKLALRHNPQLACAYANRGMAWYEKKEPRKAAQDFQQALQLEPNVTQTFFFYAAARKAAGGPEKLAVEESAPLDAKELVREWGNLEHVLLEGTHTYPRDEILAAIEGDPECLFAMRAGAVLEELAGTLARRVQQGYIHRGFASAKVSGRLDTERHAVVLSIEEGARLTCGPVEIDGAGDIDVDMVREWLVSEHPQVDARLDGFDEIDGKATPRWTGSDGFSKAMDKASWPPGRPASTGTTDLETIRKALQRAFSAQGFRYAKFDVLVATDATTGQAVLKVKVTETGRLARVERVEITGNKRDSADDVVGYLGLGQGDIYTPLVHATLLHKLWASGRFLDQRVSIVESPEAERPVVVRIELTDYEKATPLAQPLSEAEQALLKFREWFLSEGITRHDLTLRFFGAPGDYRIIYSQARGVLVHLQSQQSADTGSEAEIQREVAFVGRPHELLLIDRPWSRKFQCPIHDCELITKLTVRPATKPQPDGKLFQVQVGLGVHYKESLGDAIPLSLRIDLWPVAMLSWAHSEKTTATIDDGVLTLDEAERGRIRIAVATGRLLEWTIKWPETGINGLSISVDEGTFAARLAAIEANLPRPLGEIPNSYSSQRPIGSLVAAALDSSLGDCGLHLLAPDLQSANVDRIRHTLSKMAGAGVFDPFEKLLSFVSQGAGQGEDYFHIPMSVEKLSRQRASATTLMATMLIGWGNEIFPHGSWPSTLWQDLVLMQYSDHSWTNAINDELMSLAKDVDSGPLARLCLAMWPGASKQWASSVAFAGIDHLRAYDFAKDYQPLLARDKMFGATLFRLAEVLRDLDDEDVRPFDELLFGKDRTVLVTAARTLRERREEKLEGVLPAVLYQVWNDGLRDYVQNALRELYNRNYEVARKPESKIYPRTGAEDSLLEKKHAETPEMPSLQPKSPGSVFHRQNPNGASK